MAKNYQPYFHKEFLMTKTKATFREGGPDPSNIFLKRAKSNNKNIYESLMLIIRIKLAKDI